jgi:hypothetical protein
MASLIACCMLMLSPCPKFIQLLLLGGLLTGCATVYVPMQPTVSTIHHTGELELGASIQAKGRMESTVVYSPMPNLLFTGAGTYRPQLTDTTFMTTRQWEAGMGFYCNLGRSLSVTGIGGYGKANNHRGIFSGVQEDYQARYRKTFGQLGLTCLSQDEYLGVVYRLSKIEFDQLDYSDGVTATIIALPLHSMLRHEALLFSRFGIDKRSVWQVQSSVGLSFSTLLLPGQYQAQAASLSAADQVQAEQVAKVRRGVPMLSIGVVFHPTLLRKQ